MSTKLIDDGPVYHAVSVHLSRAKSIARFDDRYTEAKFSNSRVRDKVPEESILIFEGTGISCYHSVSSHAKNHLDSSNRFGRTPTCDRQTDTDS